MAPVEVFEVLRGSVELIASVMDFSAMFGQTAGFPRTARCV